MGRKKLFKDLEQSSSDQLKLFELLDVDEKYSNAIVVDLIPKWYWGKPVRVEGKYLPVLEREFLLDGSSFSMKIFPASIKNNGQEEEYFYLGKIEENVETALRKFITDGFGLYLNGEVGVVFTFYQLQQELSRTGHNYSYPQIKKALKILSRVSIEIQSQDTSLDFSFNIISELGFAGEEGETQTFVRFSNFLSSAMETKNYRLFNYDSFMELENVVARYLFKRMSIFYRQASIQKGLEYTIGIEQIVQGSCLKEQKYPSLYLRTIYPGLLELRDKGIIFDFKDTLGKSCKDFEENEFENETVPENEPKSGRRKKNKDEKNIKFSITPTFAFIQDVKLANQRTTEKVRIAYKPPAKELSE